MAETSSNARDEGGCSLPCAPTPGERPPVGAVEHLGVIEFWLCLKHGSHSGQRRSLTWWQNGQKYGWWEWSHVS